MPIDPGKAETNGPGAEPLIRLRLTIVAGGPHRFIATIVDLGPPEIEYIRALRSSKEECRALARYAARLLGAGAVEERDLTVGS